MLLKCLGSELEKNKKNKVYGYCQLQFYFMTIFPLQLLYKYLCYMQNSNLHFISNKKYILKKVNFIWDYCVPIAFCLLCHIY